MADSHGRGGLGHVGFYAVESSNRRIWDSGLKLFVHSRIQNDASLESTICWLSFNISKFCWYQLQHENHLLDSVCLARSYNMLLGYLRGSLPTLVFLPTPSSSPTRERTLTLENLHH